MNQDDIKKIIDAIPDLKIRKWNDKDIRFLFKIMYYCALRPMEALTLSKEDFNLVDRYVKLGNTKTEKNAKAIIPMLFVQDLDDWLWDKEPGKLWVNLQYITFYKWLKRLGKLCDIEAWTTHRDITGELTVGHIFRKSVAKAMLNGEIKDKDGGDIQIPVISKHLRHKDVAMTLNHYLKSSQEAVRQTF
jgi:integrase